MSLELILFIIIQLFSLIYLIEAFRRVIHRSKEYPLAESADTLPFGFVRMRHVVILYLGAYLFWVVLSAWVYLSLVQSHTPLETAPAPTSSFESL